MDTSISPSTITSIYPGDLNPYPGGDPSGDPAGSPFEELLGQGQAAENMDNVAQELISMLAYINYHPTHAQGEPGPTPEKRGLGDILSDLAKGAAQ